MSDPLNDAPPTPPATGSGGYPDVPTAEVPADQRTPGMLCHLLALVALLGIPFGNILGPLIMWLVKKDEMPFVNDQGKESLNFQITMAIAAIVAGISILVLIGFLLLPAVLIVWLVFTIIGSIKASNGEYYRYPFALRLIK